MGECSAECGMGTQTNTRTKLVEEANGGTCSGQPTEIVECMLKECPGMRARQFTILHNFIRAFSVRFQ